MVSVYWILRYMKGSGLACSDIPLFLWREWGIWHVIQIMVWLSKQGPHYYVITMVITTVQGFVSLYVHMHTYIYLHVNVCIHVRSMHSDLPVIVVSWRNIQSFWEHDFILFYFVPSFWLLYDYVYFRESSVFLHVWVV